VSSWDPTGFEKEKKDKPQGKVFKGGGEGPPQNVSVMGEARDYGGDAEKRKTRRCRGGRNSVQQLKKKREEKKARTTLGLEEA